jgi:hypothetical protein
VTLLLNAFIITYLFAAWCWRLPHGTTARTIVEPLLPWLRWAGLEQGWSMFTPDPPQASHELRAVIKLQSGRALVWEPPPTHAISAWSAFVRFRYREYASTIVSESAAQCRPALIDYLLRKYSFDADPAVEVILTCRRIPVPPPGAKVAAEPPATFILYTHDASKTQ